MNFLSKRPYVQNVAILISGTAVSQLIVLVASPVLSRIYDPTAFGIFAVTLAVAAPFIEVASLKYELAIVLAKKEEDADNLFVLSAGIVVLIALIATAPILIGRNWIAEQMGNPSAAALLLFSPAFILCVGLYNVMASWLNRRRYYRNIAVSEIWRSGSMVAIQILLGLMTSVARDLILGRLTGWIVGLAILVRQVGKRDWSLIPKSFNYLSIRRLAREHSQFPKYSAPREFLVSLSSSITPLFLAILISPASAGLFSFAVTILEAPNTLVGKAVRRVFFERAVILHHDNENLLPLLTKTTLALAGLGLIPTAVVILFGPGLFDLIFSSTWREAGVYAQWLMIWWLSSFYASGAMTLVSILKIQRESLLIEIAGIILRFSGLVVGVMLMGDIMAIALYSMAGFIINTVRMAHVFYHVVRQAPEPAVVR